MKETGIWKKEIALTYVKVRFWYK